MSQEITYHQLQALRKYDEAFDELRATNPANVSSFMEKVYAVQQCSIALSMAIMNPSPTASITLSPNVIERVRRDL